MREVYIMSLALISKHVRPRLTSNDLTIGWQKLNPLSHATLAPQARQADQVLKF